MEFGCLATTDDGAFGVRRYRVDGNRFPILNEVKGKGLRHIDHNPIINISNIHRVRGGANRPTPLAVVLTANERIRDARVAVDEASRDETNVMAVSESLIKPLHFEGRNVYNVVFA